MSFLTYDEIFKSLVEDISKDNEEKQIFLSYRKEDLIHLHHSMGQWIRNIYKLWHEDNPLTVGYINDETKHPDEISQKLIEDVWSYLVENE